MHFHLPKPLHGWREFLGEVGIIVIGVLVALGAEQIVENFHQRSELREAEDAMVAELRDDDLPQAYVRVSLYHCYSDQLDRIEQAVATGDRVKAVALKKAYHPVLRSWDDQAWQAALASQVLVPSGAKQLLGWSKSYLSVPLLQTTATLESHELPQLWTDVGGKGSLSMAQQDRLFGVIADLRRDNDLMTDQSTIFMRYLDEQGLRLTASQKAALLREARDQFGGCVIEPAPQRADMQSQIPGGFSAARGSK